SNCGAHPGEPPPLAVGTPSGEVAQREGVVASPPGTLFSCACRDVLGWGFSEGRLEIFHGGGEWLPLRLPRGAAPQVVARLQVRAASRG
ncbi:SIPA1 protein, partial [Cettia cetti]|nr:SIPA1 protein [Cettia cetti]